MTSRDSDQAAFIARKLAPPPVASQISESRFNAFLDSIVQLVDRDYRSARTEANELLGAARENSNMRVEYKSAQDRINALCNIGQANGIDLVVAREGTTSNDHSRLGNGRTTGFVTSRTRNAAIMMAQFPKVDLFIPSIVDFYEGNPEGYSDPTRQMQYYTALAIVSRGRFLPMVSFNPERYYEEVRDRHVFNNLDLVRNAILVGGAIGVKVHPSSGFDPYSNSDFAQLGEGPRSDQCHDRSDDNLKYRNAERYEVMDEGMAELFKLCSELQVPILTHSGTTIASVSPCMYDDDDPNNWTNSTYHWSLALERARRTAPNAKVVLAHFAGGFGEMYSRKAAKELDRDNEWFQPDPFEYDTGRRIRPSQWLQAAIDHIKTSPAADMYIDTSVMDELAYSQAFRENRNVDKGADPVWDINPGIRLTSRGAIEKARMDVDEGPENFADKFSEFIANNTELHDRFVYGSDLHMQSVATVSTSDAYLDLIEGAVPDLPGLRDSVMGLNATNLFGLRQGNANRRRIEELLIDTGTDPKSVPWIQKIDAT